VLYPLKSAKALAIKSIGGEDMDGSSFCKSGVRLMLCFSKYSCTLAFALRVAIESAAAAQLICAN